MRERHARKRLLTMAALAAVLIAGATAAAYGLTGHDGGYSRPSGIPASIPDSQVNLMELSPVPVRPAPGFTLTDQDGRVLPLSAFRGKVVVLEFMDPHCADICRSCPPSSPMPTATLARPARSSSPPSTSTSTTTLSPT